MLGRFFRRGKVWPGFLFPRGKIYTGILFPGAILSRAVFPGGSSMRGGGGNSMLQHRDVYGIIRPTGVYMVHHVIRYRPVYIWYNNTGRVVYTIMRPAVVYGIMRPTGVYMV